MLLAGGIGVTPLLSMAKTLVRSGVKTPLYFIHAARHSRVQALAAEVRALALYDNVSTHVIYDDPLETDLRNGMCNSVGTVGKQFLENRTPYEHASYYFCVPKAFMQSVYSGLKELGVGDDRISFEFFGPRQEITAVAPVA